MWRAQIDLADPGNEEDIGRICEAIRVQKYQKIQLYLDLLNKADKYWEIDTNAMYISYRMRHSCLNAQLIKQ